MKILAAADLHADEKAAEKLSEKAKKGKVDLIILAGDIFDYGGGRAEILDVFKKEKQKVLFIPGNCDFDEESAELKKRAKCIHNYYVTYSDVGILGFGSPNWTLELNKNDLEKINKNFEKMKTKKKIFVSHLHAAGTKAEFSGIPGDYVITKAVKNFKPDILISGHIHEAEGLEDIIGETKVFQVGKKGKIIEV